MIVLYTHVIIWTASILMIGAVESYLKNCFKTILTFIYPEKIGSNNTEKIIRRYSFQNLDSLVKAYSWLCPDFEKTKIYKTRHPEDFYEKIDLYDSLKEMLDRRHRIVHESFYFDDFDENLFNFFSWLAFTWATNFDYFFTDNKYYDRIDEKTRYDLIPETYFYLNLVIKTNIRLWV